MLGREEAGWRKWLGNDTFKVGMKGVGASLGIPIVHAGRALPTIGQKGTFVPDTDDAVRRNPCRRSLPAGRVFANVWRFV